MIKTIKNTTSVEFSKTENGTIAIKASDNTISLQELMAVVKIGDKWKEGDQRELPKVNMEFHKVESVDALIAALERVKRNMTYPPDNYALAC